jgi:diguanylate cyclase (GGDEF)-like protein
MPAQQPGAAVDTRRFLPDEEVVRLAALRSYCVLDTGREGRFDDLTRLAAGICETPVSLVSLVDFDRLFFKSSFGTDIRDIPRPGFCDHAILQREVFQVPDASRDPRFREHPLVLDSPHVRFYAGAPLVTPQNLALGTLCVLDFVPRSLQLRQTEMLRTLAGQVMIQLELTLEAMRDPLTGLYNRRQMEESLHREILRARRIGATVGVMVIDVDNFKRINDTLGHEAGDAALHGIAAELALCVREEDIACRAGGEEFVIILPGTTEEALRQRAETVRCRVEASSVAAGGSKLKLTVSTGLATFPDHGENGPAVLRAADAALYRAKAEGRNRVVMFPPKASPGLVAGIV